MMHLSYHLSNLSLIALEAMRLLVLIITVGKSQRFDWLRAVQLIINFCVTKEKHFEDQQNYKMRKIIMAI